MDVPHSLEVSSRLEACDYEKGGAQRIEAHMQVPGDADALALAKSGKKQVLKRRFGFLSMTAFSCGLLCTWEGVLVFFTLGFSNGGPAGLICSFFITWIGTLSVLTVMGELTSMIPTAGGQYHWVNILAPASWRRFLSYVTGWITVSGWTVGTASLAFFVASLIQALLAFNLPSYTPIGWHGTLLVWAILLVCVVVNTVFARVLPATEVGILVLHIVGFFAVLVPLTVKADKTDARSVFTTWQNAGGWETQALSFLVGMNGNAIAFAGADGIVHMSEEVKNAPINIPRSMLLSAVVNGIMAFGILLATLFCMGSLEDAMANAPNGFPFIVILATGLGSKPAATVLTCVIVVLELCCAIGSVAAASRMVWSFARDRGVPGYSVLKKVDKRTTVPLMAILLVLFASILISLINIGSTTAFNAVVSMTLEAFFSSYLLPFSILLYRRIRGDIRVPASTSTTTPATNPIAPTATTTTENDRLSGTYEWGPWRVKGIWGTLNNAIACVYLVVIMFFSYWPTTKPVTAVNMNWSSTVLGSVAFLSMAYYLLRARKSYVGPVVEVRVAE